MALSLSTFADVMNARCGKLAEFAGLEVTIASPQVLDAASNAIRAAGAVTPDPSTASDSDFLQVEESLTSMVLDYGELRMLESIQGNLTEVDTIIGPERQNYSQIISQLSLRILRLSRRIEKQYGILLATAEMGIFSSSSSEA